MVAVKLPARVLGSKNSHRFQNITLQRICAHYTELDFRQFSLHLALPGVKYVIGILLEFSSIPVQCPINLTFSHDLDLYSNYT